MTRAETLEALCRLLRGEAVADPDWPAIVGLANIEGVTPRLEPRLPGDAPADLVAFVADVARRNAARNARLYRQMGEAAAALNGAGVTPMAIKGAASLARTGGVGSDMLGDVDLVVAPEAVEASIAALEGAGFSQIFRARGAEVHAVAAFARDEDAGPLDLHQRPPGPPGFASAPAVALGGIVTAVGKGRVRVPEPHLNIYLQALHDQLHDGAFWRGGFDLRHLFDIADLAADGNVDWEALAALAPTRFTGHAVAAHLEAARRLAGAKVPQNAVGRRHYWRQRRQYDSPWLATPLAVWALAVEAPFLAEHRRVDKATRAAAGLPAMDEGIGLRLARLRGK